MTNGSNGESTLQVVTPQVIEELEMGCRAMAVHWFVVHFHFHKSPITLMTGLIQRLNCPVKVGPSSERTVDLSVSAIGVHLLALRMSIAQGTHGATMHTKNVRSHSMGWQLTFNDGTSQKCHIKVIK